MDIRNLTPELSVSDQLNIKDVGLIKSMGYNSIICNRPDGEDAFQPLFESIKAAAKLAGVTARYVPVSPDGLTTKTVKDFAEAYAELEKPILAYCRSGARSQSVFNRMTADVAAGKVA